MLTYYVADADIAAVHRENNLENLAYASIYSWLNLAYPSLSRITLSISK